MKINFLGTNGWFDTDTGNTLCTFIETKERYIVLDAGTGIYKIGRLIKNKKKPVQLYISHYHLDHIIGLHTLALFDFPQGMDVYGPPGLKKMFGRIINRPYSMALSQLKTKIRLHELELGESPEPGKLPKLEKTPGPKKFSASGTSGRLPGGEFLPLQHAVPCYGFRFDVKGKILSYTTDTGLCPNLYRIMKDADLAICESAFLPGMERDPWGHLRPEDAADAAKKSGAKKLALVHFDAGLYHTLDDREKAAKTARRIFKNTFAAVDGLVIKI